MENKKFKFLFVGGWAHSWNDRKGASYLIKSFCEEFNKDDLIELVIKVNSSYGINLEKSLNDLGIENKNPPKVQIILESLTINQLNKLYNDCDVIVSTSMAEGFNMPLLEGMACGKPCITTNFGGQTDFCNEENSWILKEGEMKENKWDINYEGVSWKEPNVDEIRKVLREVYNDWKDNDNKIIKQKRQRALEDSRKFTWNDSALKAYECLKNI